MSYVGSVFLPYRYHDTMFWVRDSVCMQQMAYVYKRPKKHLMFFSGTRQYTIRIRDEFYPEQTYVTLESAKDALDEILIRNGCKLLNSVEDADKYRILL